MEISKLPFNPLLPLGIVIAAIVTVPSVAYGDNLYGDLPALNSITFTPSSGTTATAIPLTINTALPLTSVGNVNVQSNAYAGFRVEVESANLGFFKKGTGAAMAYTLTYNNQEEGQITTNTVVEDNNALIPDCAGAFGCDRDVKIAISQSEVSGKPAGLYSDTSTFTLINK